MNDGVSLVRFSPVNLIIFSVYYINIMVDIWCNRQLLGEGNWHVQSFDIYLGGGIFNVQKQKKYFSETILKIP